MAEDEFYVDDESPDEVRDVWRRGEKGETQGPRDLNHRAKSIVDRAVSRLDDGPVSSPETKTVVINAEGWFGAAADATELPTDLTEPVRA